MRKSGQKSAGEIWNSYITKIKPTCEHGFDSDDNVQSDFAGSNSNRKSPYYVSSMVFLC